MTGMEIAALVKMGTEIIIEIAQIVAAAQAGDLDPNEAIAKISPLHQRIVERRAAVDELVDEKFPKP